MELKKFWKFTFVCNRRSNRSGFVHECTMFDEGNHELASSKCQYYNRTWEPRTYYTAINEAIRNLKHEELEHAIYRYKAENNCKRLTAWKREKIVEEFNNSQFWKRLAECEKAIKDYKSVW